MYFHSPLNGTVGLRQYSRGQAVLLTKFGEHTVVANAHVKCITSLPVVSEAQANRIYDFCEKLYVSVLALTTIKKLIMLRSLSISSQGLRRL